MNFFKLGVIAALAAAVVTIACQNSGEGLVLGIEATGVVLGQVYFDRNGNRVFDSGDSLLSNVPVRLVIAGTRDTAARATFAPNGTGFVMTAVPVGTYRVAVDSALPGDSIRVTRIDTTVVTLRQSDTVFVRIAVSYPQVTIPEFRALPVGKKAFIVGVALNARNLFGDTTVNLADPNTAIRLSNVRSSIVSTGDSIRVLGLRNTRDGQPVLDRGTVFSLSIDAVPPVHQISSAAAATAQTGALDAALIRLVNARIMDAATVDSGRRLHVNDNSGLVEVMLNTVVGFSGAALLPDTVGGMFDIFGLLVPLGGGGWRVQPRAVSDMVKH